MTRLVLGLYSLLLALALPLYRLRRLLAGRPAAPAAARSRGFPERGERPTIWLHGVSVGEVLAARALVAAIRTARPGVEILVSTTTRAGLDVARRSYPDLRTFHAPYDLAGPVRRALAAIRPDLLVLVELEIWPRLLDECRRRDIPVALVNAGVSPASARGYRRLLHVLPELFEPLRLVAARSDAEAARFAGLGLPEGRICVTGSIKVDNLPATASEEVGRKLRRELGFGEEPVFLAGSTHEGEDEAVLEATRAIRSRMPNTRLVLAPRHLERLPAVLAEARRRGFEPRLRSEAGDGAADLVVVDTMGELAALFAAADLVFLGGSLVARGGHNLLEPAAAGRVQLVGPHHETMADFARELEAAGVLRVVRDAGEMAREATAILARTAAGKDGAARAARAVVERHRGASDRTLRYMEERGLLPDERA